MAVRTQTRNLSPAGCGTTRCGSCCATRPTWNKRRRSSRTSGEAHCLGTMDHAHRHGDALVQLYCASGTRYRTLRPAVPCSPNGGSEPWRHPASQHAKSPGLILTSCHGKSSCSPKLSPGQTTKPPVSSVASTIATCAWITRTKLLPCHCTLPARGRCFLAIARCQRVVDLDGAIHPPMCGGAPTR